MKCNIYPAFFAQVYILTQKIVKNIHLILIKISSKFIPCVCLFPNSSETAKPKRAEIFPEMIPLVMSIKK